MSDEFLVEHRIPPPLDGVWADLDPALDDTLFPPTRAQDLSNVRASRGKWETRLGSSKGSLPQAPFSGSTRLFDVLYETDGSRYRLIARGENNGAALFDLEEGVDSAYQSVSGGTGLGTTTSTQPYFDFEQLGDAGYLTDRFGALRKYAPSTGALAAVTIPTAPAVSPRVKAWTYSTLEAWTGGGTMGWTESNNGDFDISEGSATRTPPMGTNVGHIDVSGSVMGATITKNVASQELPSHTIAFWYFTDQSIRKNIQLGLGINEPDEFVEQLWGPTNGEWWPIFFDIGNLPIVHFKRFKMTRTNIDEDFYISEMLLPGRLQGFYRWGYTHYNPTSGHESGLSPVSNDGEAMDFSAVGRSRGDGTVATKAMQKSAMLDFTSDSGSDAATTKIRIYRSGGVESLTTGPDGRSLWFRVGEINDTSTLLNGAHLATDTTLDVDTHVGFATDDWIVIAKGTSTEEYQKVVTAAANVLTVTPGLVNNQSDNATIQIAFLDNTGNEAIDVLATVDEERDTAPNAAKFIVRAPDNRLWLFFTADGLMSVAVSNRATPLRPNDHECFPDDVDPFTRANPNQGWRFGIGADSTGEQGVWGGFFRGLPHALTRNKMFRVHALSQTEWGANAVQKVLDVGCIGGETVQQLDGYLYWVAEGPQVVRWDGEGPVEVLSHQRVNVRLEAALDLSGELDSKFWFARTYKSLHGKYYSLWFNYVDGLGNFKRLDYNVTQNAWEPCQWFDGNGVSKAWNSARVWDGSTDIDRLVGVTYRGNIIILEDGNTDDGEPIRFSLKTKRTPLGYCGQVHEVYIRLAAATDSMTLTVRAGGSDYGDTSGSYTVSLSGSGDVERRIPVERTVKGRWVELELSGNVSNRPAVRDLAFWAKPIRERKSVTD